MGGGMDDNAGNAGLKQDIFIDFNNVMTYDVTRGDVRCIERKYCLKKNSMNF